MIKKNCFALLIAIFISPLHLMAASIQPEATCEESSPSFIEACRPTPKKCCKQITCFNSSNFSHPTTIDNKWFPLIPGTQRILIGTVNEDGEEVKRRQVFTVTDLTKVIQGVRTLVILDLDYDNGQLVEAELAFFAQDNKGNVWSLGEYPEEYENGKFIGVSQTWITGVRGAKAGTLMLAKPKVGTPCYLQGSSPSIKFLDCAQVLKIKQKTCVPFGCYEDVLVIDEWSPLDPEGGIQRKYFASGVGNIKIEAIGDPERETLKLITAKSLTERKMAEIRRIARRLDRRGYRISKVYRHTGPLRLLKSCQCQ